ncbi:MAG: 4a-hydroxytetrahydrobiopterin dehydratase [Dehalococcoidia bacterium]|nr:4a-hydroxytetrahydrobiopterin dehydratase [Dehalococcoidia bacterium]
MASRDRLDDQAITQALSALDGWQRDGDQIVREFEFRDFVEAFGFLARVAILQEKANHHAETWGVYNKVRLTLSTHDAGGITQKDVDLAREVDVLLRQ